MRRRGRTARRVGASTSRPADANDGDERATTDTPHTNDDDVSTTDNRPRPVYSCGVRTPPTHCGGEPSLTGDDGPMITDARAVGALRRALRRALPCLCFPVPCCDPHRGSRAQSQSAFACQSRTRSALTPSTFSATPSASASARSARSSIPASTSFSFVFGPIPSIPSRPCRARYSS